MWKVTLIILRLFDTWPLKKKKKAILAWGEEMITDAPLVVNPHNIRSGSEQGRGWKHLEKWIVSTCAVFCYRCHCALSWHIIWPAQTTSVQCGDLFELFIFITGLFLVVYEIEISQCSVEILLGRYILCGWTAKMLQSLQGFLSVDNSEGLEGAFCDNVRTQRQTMDAWQVLTQSP